MRRVSSLKPQFRGLTAALLREQLLPARHCPQPSGAALAVGALKSGRLPSPGERRPVQRGYPCLRQPRGASTSHLYRGLRGGVGHRFSGRPAAPGLSSVGGIRGSAEVQRPFRACADCHRLCRAVHRALRHHLADPGRVGVDRRHGANDADAPADRRARTGVSVGEVSKALIEAKEDLVEIRRPACHTEARLTESLRLLVSTRDDAPQALGGRGATSGQPAMCAAGGVMRANATA